MEETHCDNTEKPGTGCACYFLVVVGLIYTVVFKMGKIKKRKKWGNCDIMLKTAEGHARVLFSVCATADLKLLQNFKWTLQHRPLVLATCEAEATG